MLSASSRDPSHRRHPSRRRSIAMKLKPFAVCAAIGGSTMALAVPAQSAVQYNDPVPIHYYADATGNTDGYRSGSDNANIATYQPSGNPDAYGAGSNNAG